MNHASPSERWTSSLRGLHTLYASQSLRDVPDSDALYLKEAFCKVEHWWNEQFDLIDRPIVVMLSEAPLFGDDKSYFYNPAAGATSFFGYKDGESIVGPILGPRKLPKTKIERPGKREMLEKLASKGFLVLDLFPYSLNPGCTQVSYPDIRSKPGYDAAFHECVKCFLKPKLLRIKKKAQNHPIKFVFRYAFLRDRLAQKVKRELHELEMIEEKCNIESIHKGRNIDTTRLAALFQSDR